MCRRGSSIGTGSGKGQPSAGERKERKEKGASEERWRMTETKRRGVQCRAFREVEIKDSRTADRVVEWVLCVNGQGGCVVTC